MLQKETLDNFVYMYAMDLFEVAHLIFNIFAVPLVYKILFTCDNLASHMVGSQSRSQSRGGESRDSENFSALSAGAYTTTWLVRVT
jgi:hypothetical protein